MYIYNGFLEYVPVGSNHPPYVQKNIPKGVEKRLISLSSDESCFNSAKHIYQDSLNKAGYDYSISFNSSTSSQQERTTQVVNNEAPDITFTHMSHHDNGNKNRKRK